jgi:hypothetical protein
MSYSEGCVKQARRDGHRSIHDQGLAARTSGFRSVFHTRKPPRPSLAKAGGMEYHITPAAALAAAEIKRR